MEGQAALVFLVMLNGSMVVPMTNHGACLSAAAELSRVEWPGRGGGTFSCISPDDGVIGTFQNGVLVPAPKMMER